LTGLIGLHISALPPAAGPEFARLCGLVFPTSNGVDRPGRFNLVAAERVKSIGWAACLSRDGAVRFFDNLVRRKRNVDGEVFAGAIRVFGSV
jgi:hypothetical protein